MIQNAPVASEHAQLYTPDLTVPILGLTLASGGDVGSPRLTSRYASLYLLQLRTAFDQGAEDGTSDLQHAYPQPGRTVRPRTRGTLVRTVCGVAVQSACRCRVAPVPGNSSSFSFYYATSVNYCIHIRNTCRPFAFFPGPARASTVPPTYPNPT